MFGKRNDTAKPAGLFPILYDGWPLVFASGSPAALHLLEILTALPIGVKPWVALPFAGEELRVRRVFGSLPLFADVEQGLESEAASAVRPVCAPTPDTPSGRLRWQQWTLPGLVRQTGAKLLHSTGDLLPLFSNVPVIASPTWNSADTQPVETFPGRLGNALGRGGWSSARAVLWPADLPGEVSHSALQHLPIFVHPAFSAPQSRADGLPESYVLVAGQLDTRALDLLAAAWSWAQVGLGDEWSLVACDIESTGLQRLRQLCQEAGIDSPVERAPVETPEQRAALFQHAGAVLALGPVLPWGDALLQALSTGRPLIAEESPLRDARTGPAAYLTPRGDARALGAAMITVIVEEDVAEQLSQAARQRAAAWNAEAFSRELAAAYGIKNEADLA